MNSHITIVEQLIRDQTERNERFFSWLTEDVIVKYPIATGDHPKQLNGKQAIREFGAKVSKSLPKLEVHDLWIDLLRDDNTVIAEFEYYTAPGVAPVYRSRYCNIARFRGDLVSEYTMYFDPTALPAENLTLSRS